MNVLLKRIMLELIHLSLVFFADVWNTLLLLLRQATTIASFKKGVREFLAEMCEVFIIIIIIIITIILLIAFFCTYLHMRFHIFNCLSYLVLVFTI